jgi:hypothetical protein
LIVMAGLVLFSLSILILAIVVMVTPNTLETRPIEDSPNQRRELEEFVPSTAYQIRSTKLDLCMTTLWVSRCQYFAYESVSDLSDSFVTHIQFTVSKFFFSRRSHLCQVKTIRICTDSKFR